MKPQLVLTGSSGRIGRAIYVELCHEFDVVGVDLSPASTTRHHVSVDDYDRLAPLFEGAVAVIHVAALHAPHVGLRDDTEFKRVNIDGTAAIVRAAAGAGVERLVFTSTTALYGLASNDAERAVWIDEQTRPQPRTIYHQTKLAAEQLLEDAVGGGLTIRVLRMSRCFPEPAPRMASYRLHRGIDARDVASAHRLALTDRGADFACYVVSGATPFVREDVGDLKHRCAAVLARRCPALIEALRTRGWPLPKSIGRVYDSSAAQQQLGWRPRHGFDAVLDMLRDRCSEVLPPAALPNDVAE